MDVDELRTRYAAIEYIDPAPSDGAYAELCALLDSCDDEMLWLLVRARIKWVSQLALRRWNARPGVRFRYFNESFSAPYARWGSKDSIEREDEAQREEEEE